MDPAVKSKLTRYAIILAAALVVIIPLYNFLVSSSVQIVASDPSSTITLQETSPENKTITADVFKGKYKTRLHHGTYLASAKNGYASAQQIFTVTGIAGSKKINLQINSTANQQSMLESVTDMGAYSTVADPNSIKFLDRNHNPTRLYQIDSGNTLTSIAPDVSFDSISWADTSFGVGQAGKNLVAISGTSTSQLSLPISVSTYTVAPNRDVYVSDGSSLYRGASGQGFAKVLAADANATMTIVSATNNTVLVTTKSKDAAREGELIALHKDGSKNKTDGELYEGAWSKSGKYLAVSGDTTSIFNDQLQKVVSLPIANVQALAWIDDTTLAYADNNLVWKFSVTDHQSSVLATTPNGVGTVSQLTPSSDSSSLYVSIQNADVSNGYTFYLTRYRLRNAAPINPVLQKMGLALPATPADGCRVGYVNFTKPDITVIAAGSAQQSCTTTAHSYLQSYDIDPRAVGTQFIPSL